MAVVKQWNRMAGRSCGVPIFEAIKKLDTQCPKKSALVDPASSTGWIKWSADIPSNLKCMILWFICSLGFYSEFLVYIHNQQAIPQSEYPLPFALTHIMLTVPIPVSKKYFSWLYQLSIWLFSPAYPSPHQLPVIFHPHFITSPYILIITFQLQRNSWFFNICLIHVKLLGNHLGGKCSSAFPSPLLYICLPPLLQSSSLKILQKWSRHPSTAKHWPTINYNTQKASTNMNRLVITGGV